MNAVNAANKAEIAMMHGCVANIPKAATRTYLRAKLSC
jgi:hypothetical protein